MCDYLSLRWHYHTLQLLLLCVCPFVPCAYCCVGAQFRCLLLFSYFACTSICISMLKEGLNDRKESLPLNSVAN